MAEFWGNLISDVQLQNPELGQEILIRARVVTLEEDTIEITSMGKPKRVIAGMNKVRLMPLEISDVGAP